MNKRANQVFFSLMAIALVTQVSLAQSADYFLERVAIHARLMQVKAPTAPLNRLTDNVKTPEPEMVFASTLSILVADLDAWKEMFPANKKAPYQEVRAGLEQHRTALMNASELLELSPEQATHYNLLLLELEQASENIDREYLQIATRTEKPRRRNRVLMNVGVGPAWNAWGGPWGGWGAWGAGPYFGQPFGPGFGPGLFGPRCW